MSSSKPSTASSASAALKGATSRIKSLLRPSSKSTSAAVSSPAPSSSNSAASSNAAAPLAPATGSASAPAVLASVSSSQSTANSTTAPAAAPKSSTSSFTSGGVKSSAAPLRSVSTTGTSGDWTQLDPYSTRTLLEKRLGNGSESIVLAIKIVARQQKDQANVLAVCKAKSSPTYAIRGLRVQAVGSLATDVRVDPAWSAPMSSMIGIREPTPNSALKMMKLASMKMVLTLHFDGGREKRVHVASVLDKSLALYCLPRICRELVAEQANFSVWSASGQPSVSITQEILETHCPILLMPMSAPAAASSARRGDSAGGKALPPPLPANKPATLASTTARFESTALGPFAGTLRESLLTEEERAQLYGAMKKSSVRATDEDVFSRLTKELDAVATLTSQAVFDELLSWETSAATSAGTDPILLLVSQLGDVEDRLLKAEEDMAALEPEVKTLTKSSKRVRSERQDLTSKAMGSAQVSKILQTILLRHSMLCDNAEQVQEATNVLTALPLALRSTIPRENLAGTAAQASPVEPGVRLGKRLAAEFSKPRLECREMRLVQEYEGELRRQSNLFATAVVNHVCERIAFYYPLERVETAGTASPARSASPTTPVLAGGGGSSSNLFARRSSDACTGEASSRLEPYALLVRSLAEMALASVERDEPCLVWFRNLQLTYVSEASELLRRVARAKLEMLGSLEPSPTSSPNWIDQIPDVARPITEASYLNQRIAAEKAMSLSRVEVAARVLDTVLAWTEREASFCEAFGLTHDAMRPDAASGLPSAPPFAMGKLSISGLDKRSEASSAARNGLVDPVERVLSAGLEGWWTALLVSLDDPFETVALHAQISKRYDSNAFEAIRRVLKETCLRPLAIRLHDVHLDAFARYCTSRKSSALLKTPGILDRLAPSVARRGSPKPSEHRRRLSLLDPDGRPTRTYEDDDEARDGLSPLGEYASVWVVRKVVELHLDDARELETLADCLSMRSARIPALTTILEEIRLAAAASQ